jgi:hypothetical protein
VDQLEAVALAATAADLVEDIQAFLKIVVSYLVQLLLLSVEEAEQVETQVLGVLEALVVQRTEQMVVQE